MTAHQTITANCQNIFGQLQLQLEAETEARTNQIGAFATTD